MTPPRRIALRKQIDWKMASTDSSIFEELVYDETLRVFNRAQLKCHWKLFH
jgi:hypothetical protein